MEKDVVSEAVEVLRKGGVVAFPTDTVWGVGALVSSEEGVERLYAVKKRKHSKPTAVLVSDFSMAERYGIFLGKAKRLAQAYWPGGLTLIVPAKKQGISLLVLGKGETIGLRVPDHPLALELLSKVGGGLAVGSANISGEQAPRRFEDLDEDFLKVVDFVVSPRKDKRSEFESGGRDPSTVIDATRSPFRVLRRGPVQITTR